MKYRDDPYLAHETEWERYAPAIGWLHAAFFLMAADFGRDVLMGGSPITPDQYGDRVHAIPAFVWVALQMAGTAIGFAGALVGGFRGAVLCGIGSVWVAVLFGVFSILASFAPEGAVMRSGGMFVGVGLFSLAFVYSAKHVTRRWRNG